MTSGTIRRAQLISPFGVGAMSVLVDGSSVIAAGLDHWFEGEDVDVSPFRIDEWRLQRRLRVSHFRLPPHFEGPRARGASQTNVRLTIPFLRFPRWSFCMYCKRLEQHPLTFQGKARCPEPKHSRGPKSQGPAMAQVPFVAICERGHIDDFPWREWVHRTARPSCGGVLRLQSMGTGSLSGQVVTCDACKMRRPLEGVMNTQQDSQEQPSTMLSNQLERGVDYSCSGSRPWLGGGSVPCGQPIRGALRGASNVYFPLVESSIYLPQSSSTTPPKLIEILNSPQFVNALILARATGQVSPATVRLMDQLNVTKPFTDDEIQGALDEVSGGSEAEKNYDIDDLSPVDWRRPEHEMLRGQLDHPNLAVTVPAEPYDDSINTAFNRVRLVETLRETRALWGFTRVTSARLRLGEGKSQLWREQPSPNHGWLPAYTVSGEGIYLELDEQQLRQWETRDDVSERARLIESRYMGMVSRRGLAERELPPRLILIHTLAHLIINQLIFECGYSTASLRERLYVSEDRTAPMSGFLIYTSAGDSEGTMGGLVRMGRPGNLERVWNAALANAEWCSTDPVCMEAGGGGQGPDSCNLAACHSCALLPETSCEEFNRFLDRGLVIGTIKNPKLGFFTEPPA